MSARLVCLFDREEDIVAAARLSRERGWTIDDAFTPYPVHGLAEALALRPSRLPWLCGALGVVSGSFALWFQYWASAVSWPTNVGGRPWNSFPAFVPVTFEVVVLASGVGTVAAFLFLAKLRPRRHVEVVHPRVTDDRFALVLLPKDADEEHEMRRRLPGFTPPAIEERTT